MPRPFIKIARTTIVNGRVTWEIDCSQSVKAYLQRPSLWYETDSLDDLMQVPRSMLQVPVVGNLITLAWAMGADLYVDELDADFARSLSSVRDVFAKLHPLLPIRRGKLKVGRMPENRPARGMVERRVGLLYSGGLDSLTSLLDHENEVTDLFSIWGAEVRTEARETWDGVVQAALNRVDTRLNPQKHVIRTTLVEGLSRPWLNHDFGRHLHRESWWIGMQFGVGYLALTAPVAFERGVDTVLMASEGYSHRYNPISGSRPDIDDVVSWAGTTCIHDNFHRSRQEKIEEILAPKLSQGCSELMLVSCSSPSAGSASVNCGTCEKCLRTQAGLILAGIDPAKIGFETKDGMFGAEQRLFLNGLSPVSSDLKDFWTDIQGRLPENLEEVPDMYGSRAFFAWLREVDIAALPERETGTPSVIGRTHPFAFANRVGRTLPVGLQHHIKRALARPVVRRALLRM